MHFRGGVIVLAMLVISMFCFSLALWFLPNYFSYAQTSSTTSSLEEIVPQGSASSSDVFNAFGQSKRLSDSVSSTVSEVTTSSVKDASSDIFFSEKNSQVSPLDFSPSNFGSSPSINSLVISTSSAGEPITSFDLAENATATFYVRGSYSHPNGCAAVAQGSFALKIFRSGIGESCYVNDSNCYGLYSEGYSCNYSTVAQDQCELANPSDLTASFECSIPLYYFAEPTDTGVYAGEHWRALISITDTSYNSVQSFSNFTMNTLSALDVSSGLEYGEMGIGGISNPVSMTITNTGNKSGLNAQVSGTPLICISGEVPVSNQYYSVAYPYYLQSMIPLSTSSTALLLGLNRTVSKNYPSTAPLYWRMQAPVSGAGGLCNGTVSIVAE